jgi:hypothetical protein
VFHLQIATLHTNHKNLKLVPLLEIQVFPFVCPFEIVWFNYCKKYVFKYKFIVSLTLSLGIQSSLCYTLCNMFRFPRSSSNITNIAVPKQLQKRKWGKPKQNNNIWNRKQKVDIEKYGVKCLLPMYICWLVFYYIV